ncbi:GPR endopeptidase [Anoxybacter fermentans]|uniref:Germination protease n=1 Tax=Anoxybacter fermentans TaxID=1323375 RepID=A0A3S9SY12_9FIRM|nr:GPR endopeptidase [Anoxybacter fermentans]AZR73181.1 GPR endopeptidase [Anoxybacter fermentans]
MQNLGIYTDLAVEAQEMAIQRTGGEIEGVSVTEERKEYSMVTRIKVLNESAAQKIGKPVGEYVTIESQGLSTNNREIHNSLSGVIAGELERLINFDRLREDSTIFVVGLGNWNATPDALGPRVIHYLMITRHLYKEVPPELRKGLRSVCALSPGVMGLTGVQTAEIIKGVVERVKPEVIIAIDALAARSVSRLGTTIQISNAGIHPGSGLGKKRAGITQKSMGVPVIAMGIPTVVHATTIANDAIDKLFSSSKFAGAERERYNRLDPKYKNQIINEVLQPFFGNLVVTPKGIDELIQDMSRCIAGGINVALHPDITLENLSLYLA